jgi:RNA polymerase sigma factor (sigma-70 family)|tara:strand:+ start:1429 stop:1986 length:558 start_codon:yes stop_codon:yes gene_type:complete
MIFGVRKYRKYTDEELVNAYAQKPSRDILQVLFERYGHLVLGLCIKYLKQIENAEDMCASIFEKLPALLIKHEVKYFKSWLYQVSRNECLMVLRKKKTYNVPAEDVHLAIEEPEDSNSKEKEIQLLENALKELKEEQRNCVILFYLEEMSYQEISNKIGVEIKKVKSYIQNGKRNLKIKLEGNYE